MLYLTVDIKMVKNGFCHNRKFDNNRNYLREVVTHAIPGAYDITNDKIAFCSSSSPTALCLEGGQSFSPVFLPGLCFSQGSGLWPRKEKVSPSHKIAYISARDLSQVGRNRASAWTKETK